MTKRPTSIRRVQSCLVCFVMAAPAAMTPMLLAAPANEAVAKPAPPAGEVHSIPTDMGPIMTLLRGHDKIHFTIEDIPRGERTITTSDDPAIAKTIQVHAHEMRARVLQGNNIRPNDPVFIEIFKHHKEIKDVITDLPNGVTEDETSSNPQVVLLIRAHARTVATFVREGVPAARKNTPLPKGYHTNP